MKLEGDGNPFVNAKIEIKLDELLAPKVQYLLEGTGSAVTVSVGEATITRVADLLREADASTLSSEEQVRIVLGALGLTVRNGDGS